MNNTMLCRAAVTSLAAVASFGVLAGPAIAQDAATPNTVTAAKTPSARDLEFKYSLDDFLKVRKSKPKPYDWSTDACSVPKSIHIGGLSGKKIIDHFFTDQCIRHDFAYRNNHRIPSGSGTPWKTRGDLRAAVDKKLHSDMDARCSKYSYFNPQREVCFAASDVVYKAVRVFAGGHFH